MHSAAFKLISGDRWPPHSPAAESLYAHPLISAGIQPLLIDANLSSGPYLKLWQGDYILDLTSQIASGGLGFNAGVKFGAAQYLESWLDHSDSLTAQSVRRAFADLLIRHAGGGRFSVQFCTSGAEAVAIALVQCFQEFAGRRRRVLVFENSFHGRLPADGENTAGPNRRLPFTWPGLQHVCVPYPELDGADIDHPSESERRCEDRILGQIEIELQAGRIFAVLLEPWQTSGREKFSSSRFHNRLLRLCRSCQVPLIYDEIRTGCGLGGAFYWHRNFRLMAESGQPACPDIIIGGEQAQVGFVVSQLASDLDFEQPIPMASLIRGYIQASVADQFPDHVAQLESWVSESLHHLVEQFPDLIGKPRNRGLVFAFDFYDAAERDRFIQRRFNHGLFYDAAGQRSVRFRLQSEFGQRQVAFVFGQVAEALADRQTQAVTSGFRAPLGHQLFHQSLIRLKRAGLQESVRTEREEREMASGALRSVIAKPNVGDTNPTLNYLEQALAEYKRRQGIQLHPSVVTADEWGDFRERVEQMQLAVYEPARQSPIEEFDRIFRHDQALAIIIEQGDRIAGMAFAGPLALFVDDISGVRDDPFHVDPRVFYMLDLTVAKAYRGGLGRILKQALTLLAVERGVTAIHGRNRDRLARAMWVINLSLGSFTTQYLANNYPGDDAHRDCFYYRCPTTWSHPPLNLSNGVYCPLDPELLTDEFVHANLEVVVNQLVHPNLVSRDMAEQLPMAFQIFPPALRHGFAANSLSEAVDKLAQVLGYQRQPHVRLLAMQGSFWGKSTPLARSLSGLPPHRIAADFFNAHDATGNREDEAKLLAELRHKLQRGDYLAVFVEPLLQQSGQAIDRAMLERITQVCRDADTPVIFNDTAGLFFRFDSDHFSASLATDLNPDASIAFLGGKMALVGLNQELFSKRSETPISLWEGDAYSLSRFVTAQQQAVQQRADDRLAVEQFEQALANALYIDPLILGLEFHVHNGVGWIHGELPNPLCRYFRKIGNRYLIMPATWQMRRFVELQSAEL